MSRTDNDPAYEKWVRQVFDHPVTDPAWHWDIGADVAQPVREESVSHLTRLFEHPEILSVYSDAQLNQAFWYLVDSGCSDYMWCLVEPPVDLALRMRGIHAISILFRELFAKRCTARLSHLDEAGRGPLNSACYMWWDIFPRPRITEDDEGRRIELALIATMKLTLSIDSVACQESALHGLGHWAMYYPKVIFPAIDRFLANTPKLRPELKDYALRARVGYVL